MNGGLAIISSFFETLKLPQVSVSIANKLEGIVLFNLVGVANEKYTDLLQNSLDSYYEFKKEGLAINSQVYDIIRNLHALHNFK